MRQFDLTQANRLLPALTQIFDRVRGWTEQARQLTRALDDADADGPIGAPIDQPDTPSGRMRRERDELVERIRAELAGVEEMGVEVKSLDGLVDFRATREGRVVYLCWHHGEPAVGFWHELEDGFGGRQPIDDAAAFRTQYLS